MKRWLAAWLAAAVLLCAQSSRPGSKAQDFQVEDMTGAPAAFSLLRGPVTAVVFFSTRCPISSAYVDRLNAIYRDYSPRGVKFLFIDPNRNESHDEVRDFARKVGFVFPVYVDPAGEAAERLDAQVTPETYVVDSGGVIRYHGQIDDSRNEARITNHALREALESVLGGKPVRVSETKAFGCTIKRARHTS